MKFRFIFVRYLTEVVIHKDHKVYKDETCCKSYCNGIYWFFGSLLCFRKDQSLLSKLGITWLWTIFIPLFLGLMLGLYVFAPSSFMSSPGDERNVMGNYDSFFCDNISLKSSRQFDAYLLGQSPNILQNNRSINTFKLSNITVTPDFFKMWNFYLLEGSTVQFQLCNTRNTQFFMFKGMSNYNKWQKNPTNCQCFMEYISYPRGSPECAKQSSSTNNTGGNKFPYNLTTIITDTDDYYLVFQNPSNLNPIELNINLQMNRSTCNVHDNVKERCLKQISCEFPLGFLSKESVVYVSLSESEFSTGNRVFCNPTWAVYFALFGGVPVIAGFSISLLFFILYMHCPREWEGVYRRKP